MSGNIHDREHKKFVECLEGTPSVQTKIMNQLVPEEYDAINLGYDTSSNLTSAEYFVGGTSGTSVAVLTLGYSSSTLVAVSKT